MNGLVGVSAVARVSNGLAWVKERPEMVKQRAEMRYVKDFISGVKVVENCSDDCTGSNRC